MFKKYFPLFLTLIGVLAPVFSPAIQAFYGRHPEAVALFGGIWASVKWLLPSPLQNNG